MKRQGMIAIRVILTALSVMAVGFIFYNSSLDAVESSGQSGSLLGVINDLLERIGLGIELSDHFIRKAAHFTEYFVLGALIGAAAYSYVMRRRRMLMITLPAGLAVAVCDELIQLTSVGRSCEIKDMALDFTGVVCASLILTLIMYLIEKKEGKKSE